MFVLAGGCEIGHRGLYIYSPITVLISILTVVPHVLRVPLQL